MRAKLDSEKADTATLKKEVEDLEVELAETKRKWEAAAAANPKNDPGDSNIVQEIAALLAAKDSFPTARVRPRFSAQCSTNRS